MPDVDDDVVSLRSGRHPQRLSRRVARSYLAFNPIVVLAVAVWWGVLGRAKAMVDLTLAEFPGRTIPATLVRTAESIDVVSRTLLAEFDVPNPSGALWAGSYAEVHLNPPAPTSVFRLPANVLIFRADGLKIAVVQRGDIVAMTTVVVGRDVGTEVEVVSGVTGDEKVVVNAPDSLSAGQVVRVLATGRGAGEGGRR
jgi:multidrug efflux pump subunit AcrA (membrane-fusion protein)